MVIAFVDGVRTDSHSPPAPRRAGPEPLTPLAAARVRTCLGCEHERSAWAGALSFCAKNTPEADCYCSEKHARLASAQVAWLNNPGSVCPLNEWTQ